MIRSPVGFAAALCFAATSVAAAPSRPRLIVQITADQMRADLLIRYAPIYTGGLARLVRDGYWVRNGEVAHGLTNSFPGQATLASGLHPSHHGLNANEWWLQVGGKWTWVDVGDDDRYKLIGYPDRKGVSPKNLNGTALADWVKAADSRARTVAVSTGAPTAMVYAGRKPDAALWYDGQSGGFVSSTYYGQALPVWAASFNATGIKVFQQPVWSLTVPSDRISLAKPDDTPYENDGQNQTFPHAYATESRQEGGKHPAPYGSWFAGTPLKDEALFQLAADAVDAEKLGQRGATDYIAVLPDSTDSIGHNFGPNSLEQLDTLLRLDRAIGKFLDHLDRTVGRGNYLVGLSADHGVADPPEEHPGVKRVTTPEIEALLDKVEAIAIAHAGSRDALANKIAAELKRADFVADAYTEAQLSNPSTDPYVKAFQLSFRPGHPFDFPLWTRKTRLHHPARYGVIVRFKEGMIFDNAVAVHGSPYAYDRSVPVVFYGFGVRPGQKETGARTVDVAPTLAALANVPVPANLDGYPVASAIRN